VSRGARVGLLLVALLGGFIFFLMTVGSGGEPQPDVARIPVDEVLNGERPSERYGSRELHVSGWYAELAADCQGPRAPGSGSATGAGWLEARCPLRVLLPYQPAEDVTQATLERDGLRLASPTNAVFPARARPEGPNLRLQQLVYVGRFNDRAAAECDEALREWCRDTFVVSDYDGLLR
jgi:hypothetical protein